MSNKQNYITLKEAAEISGYAPDYIGQLIRKGTISGKQVYCTVAWMTTKEAVLAYKAKNQHNKGDSRLKGRFSALFQELKAGSFLEKRAAWLRAILCLVILSLLSFSLLLFYIFSVRFEKKMEQKIIEKTESGLKI